MHLTITVYRGYISINKCADIVGRSGYTYQLNHSNNKICAIFGCATIAFRERYVSKVEPNALSIL